MLRRVGTTCSFELPQLAEMESGDILVTFDFWKQNDFCFLIDLTAMDPK